ncbi:T9SS type A sorting domain-containing protein [Flammeovirga sp. MY04]|uniref:fibronectin type III domain-containing protein n=1 Tax=Flammeovirga sp. MY04 TaxID=1191459 RepID=UPI0013050A06|nr:fibronectin type III domain-containing protein [Flammeovirga sp. MY04]ANQ50863.2 T9SS type A sorting domain-containing protein [Flammeovirga sp. MY04]
MKFSLTLLLTQMFIWMSATTLYAQWINMNPGHGGRVQGLSCYENQPGRMFVCSDMEGFYLTNDYGENWIYRGQNVPTSLAILAQQSGNRIFYGSFEGIAYSDDDGVTWTENKGVIDDEPIGVITVDSKDEKRIYAGNQWLIQFTRKLEVIEDGSQVIYVTDDRGTTWNQVAYAQGTGYRRVNSITINPTNNSHILVAAGTGLYSSNNKGGNWTKIQGPAGTDGVNETIGECMGADLTKDGKWLYAIYNKRGSSRGSNQQLRASHLFVKSYPNGAWQDLGLAGVDDKIIYWQPKVWQGNEPNGKHHVLVSQFTQGRNDGLYEGEFTVNGSTVSGEIKSIFNFNKFGRGITTDAGWNQYVVNQSRNKTYWPAKWSGTWNSRDFGNVTYQRGVLTMSQQSFFVGDAANQDSWDIQSCSAISTLDNGATTYHTNGTQSTFTYDVAIHNNYAVMGQADNGMLESYDYGYSWTQLNTPSQQDAHSFLVIDEGQNPLILASIAYGWGGGNPGGNAEMAFKQLTTTQNQADDWKVFISGKQDEVARKGLPAVRSWIIKSDPNQPYRVYCGTQKGVFVTDDIRTLIDEDNSNDKLFYEAWGSLSGIPNQSLPVNDISFDPNNSNVLYVKCQLGNLKLTRNTDGSFSNELGVDVNGKSNYFNAQGNTEGGVEATVVGGNVITLTTRNNPELGNNLRRHDIYFALNGDKTYRQALYWRDALAVLGEPDWFIPEQHDFMIGDFSVHGNKIYIPYHVWQLTRKGFGVIQGTINADGSITNLVNFGADNSSHEVEYTVAQRTRVFTDDQGVTRFYMATSGGGLTAKVINGQQPPSNPPPTGNDGVGSCDGVSPAGKPNPPCNVRIEKLSSSSVKLLWNDNSNNEDYFDIQKQLEGDSFRASGMPDGDRNATEVIIDGLEDGATYSFRIKAVNGNGGSVWVTTNPFDLNGNNSNNGGNDNNTDNQEVVKTGDCSLQSSGGKPHPPCEVWVEKLSSTSVQIHWSDNSDNEDRFDIQSQLSGDSYRGGGIPDVPANQTSFVISNLGAGKQYTFRIKALNATGGSVWVETVSIDLGSSSNRANLGTSDLKVLKIYPNPNQGSFVLVSPHSGSGQIVNINGQIVGTLQWEEGENTFNIPLKEGIYFIIDTRGNEKLKLMID